VSPPAARLSSPSGLIRPTGEPRLWLRSADGSVPLLRRPLTEAEVQQLIETGKAKLVNGKGGRYLAAVIRDGAERLSAPCMAPATTEPLRIDGHKTTGVQHRGESAATGSMMIHKPRRPSIVAFKSGGHDGRAVVQPHAIDDLDDWFGPKPAGKRPPRRRAPDVALSSKPKPTRPGTRLAASFKLLPGWASAPEGTGLLPHDGSDFLEERAAAVDPIPLLENNHAD
jgi:hypothetical protein